MQPNSYPLCMTPTAPSFVREAKPLSGAAPYQGGKRILAKTIIERIKQIPHTCYAEPFVGMGGVFFRRTEVPTLEVINDYNQEVSNFFRVLQRHYTAFLDLLRFQIPSRAAFEQLNHTDNRTLTDLERAVKLYYVLRMCFGGRLRNPSFGVAPKEPTRFNIHHLASQLEELHERLSGVIIECLPYQEFIQRYDRPSTLFYLDPPYYGCEENYGEGLFSKEDFVVLAQLLKRIQGNFLLSLNDHEAVREIFADFQIENVETTYSIGGGEHAKRVKEVLISRRGVSAFTPNTAQECRDSLSVSMA